MVVVITIVLLPLILMMTTMTMVLMITILPLIILVMMEVMMLIIGNLSNDDGDVKENGNNAIGLDWQNNNFPRASRFFVHFFAVVARLQRESA